MARAWPEDTGTVFVVREQHGYHAMQPREFAAIVESFFSARRAENPLEAVARCGVHLSKSALAGTPLLLPEPTYMTEVLRDIRNRLESGKHVTAIVYDCFPMTHPETFPGNGHASVSPYFRLLHAVSVAIGTSDAVTETLTTRVRRRPETTPTVWLGMDHLDRPQWRSNRKPGHFLMIGTVEPRKRLDVAVDAMEELVAVHPDARLTVVGSPGWAEPRLLSRMRALHTERTFFSWLEHCTDTRLLDELDSATALLSLGDEGFGLPTVEALVRGCPVIYAGTQPAASLFRGAGAWKVEPLTASTLATELREWCDPSVVAGRVSRIDLGRMTTWKDFAATVHAVSSNPSQDRPGPS